MMSLLMFVQKNNTGEKRQMGNKNKSESTGLLIERSELFIWQPATRKRPCFSAIIDLCLLWTHGNDVDGKRQTKIELSSWIYAV